MSLPLKWSRLILDMKEKKSYIENIENEVQEYIGGKGLNLYYLNHVSMDEDIAVISTGPLVGTGFPCASFSYISKYDKKLGYPVTSCFGGGFGLSMKMAGFVQIVLKGKSKGLLYVFIDNEKVSFHETSVLKDKNALLTDTYIREEFDDRDIETISIGNPPVDFLDHAILFSSGNWPINRFGFGKDFIEKGLKAIGIRGDKGFNIEAKDKFLGYISHLFRKISEDNIVKTIKNKGSLAFLDKKNVYGFPSNIPEEISGKTYLKSFEAGREACPSCPIGCGKFTNINGIASSSGPLFEEVLFLAAHMKEKKLDTILMEAIRMRRECIDPFILFTEYRDAIAKIHNIEIEERYNTFKVKGMPLSFDPRRLIDLSLYCAFTIQDYDYFQLCIGMDAPQEDAFNKENRATSLKKILIIKTLSDMLGICPLPISRVPVITVEDLKEGFKILFGDEVALEVKAKGLVDMERKMGHFSKMDDMLDDTLYEVPTEYGDMAGKYLDRSMWEDTLNRFYEMMEWDSQGRPQR